MPVHILVGGEGSVAEVALEGALLVVDRVLVSPSQAGGEEALAARPTREVLGTALQVNALHVHLQLLARLRRVPVAFGSFLPELVGGRNLLRKRGFLLG